MKYCRLFAKCRLGKFSHNFRFMGSIFVFITDTTDRNGFSSKASAWFNYYIYHLTHIVTWNTFKYQEALSIFHQCVYVYVWSRLTDVTAFPLGVCTSPIHKRTCYFIRWFNLTSTSDPRSSSWFSETWHLKWACHLDSPRSKDGHRSSGQVRKGHSQAFKAHIIECSKLFKKNTKKYLTGSILRR